MQLINKESADGGELPEFARHWAEKLGCKPSRLKALRGGINNRVYLCNGERQQRIIKGYQKSKRDQHDRMEAEVQFLKLANRVTPNYIPELIDVDEHHRCVILEYINGEEFQQGVLPAQGAIDVAVKFLQQLNGKPRLANKLITTSAAEGFLSLNEHLANVGSRIERIKCEQNNSTSKAMTNILVDKLRSEFEKLQEETKRQLNKGFCKDKIGLAERCISPSDFGFHNAIMTPNGIKFIDFEFAGWDDPAKTSLDFVLQPKIAVGCKVSEINKAWGPKRKEEIERRCKVLGPILRLKWTCIILAVLDPVRLNSILETRPDLEAISLIEERIDLAGKYLARTYKIAF